MNDRIYFDSADRPCDLAVMCIREPGWAANRIKALTEEVDAQAKAKREWEDISNRNARRWRAYADKFDAIRALLVPESCECWCEHDANAPHDDECERCLVCRIGEVLG